MIEIQVLRARSNPIRACLGVYKVFSNGLHILNVLYTLKEIHAVQNFNQDSLRVADYFLKLNYKIA